MNTPIRLAMVQTQSVNRTEAAAQRAQLALLPEVFAAGFELNEHA